VDALPIHSGLAASSALLMFSVALLSRRVVQITVGQKPARTLLRDGSTKHSSVRYTGSHLGC